MKKCISYLLVFSLLLSMLVFTSCKKLTSSPPSSSSPTTKKITIWAWDPNFNIAVLNEAKERYSKINPDATIEIMEISKADVEQKLNINLAAGTNDGLPDITLIEDYNAQKFLQTYPKAFADLTDKVDYKKFADYKVAVSTYKSKTYAVPFDTGVCGLFYRIDYFEKAGIPEAALNNLTWDDYIKLGKQIKEKTGKSLAPFLPYDGGQMRIMLQSAKQWYFDEEGNINLTTNNALKEALRIYKALTESGVTIPTKSWEEWANSFNSGEAASVVSGIWTAGTLMKEKSQVCKWKIAPIPRLNIPESIHASNLGGSSWYVLNSSKNKDLAIDFLTKIFAGDDIDFFEKILVNIGAVSTYIPAYQSPTYESPNPFFTGQKVFVDFLDWMKKIPSVNYGPHTYDADSAIMAFMPDFISGKITADELLSKAEAQLKGQIGKK